MLNAAFIDYTNSSGRQMKRIRYQFDVINHHLSLSKSAMGLRAPYGSTKTRCNFMTNCHASAKEVVIKFLAKVTEIGTRIAYHEKGINR